MTEISTSQVFISYSRRDEAVTRRVVDFLRKHGIRVWLDNEKLVPGTPIWEEEIEKAIRSASAVVVVLSPDSKNSEWVRREISLADQNRKRIFPVLVRGDEDSSISLRLITRQFVDLRNNESLGLNSLQGALSQYLTEIETQLGEASDKKAEKEISESAVSEKVATDHKIENASNSRNASQILPWFTIGWTIAGFISGLIYSSDLVDSDLIAGIIGSALGGAIGGFIISITLQSGNIPGNQKNTFRTILAWVIGGVIGWAIGHGLTEASGAGIGMAIFPLIGLAGALGMDYVRSYWKSIAVITLAWAISSAIGWAISRTFLIDTLDADKATSWAIGTAIAWAVGGFVTGWQLLKNKGGS